MHFSIVLSYLFVVLLFLRALSYHSVRKYPNTEEMVQSLQIKAKERLGNRYLQMGA